MSRGESAKSRAEVVSGSSATSASTPGGGALEAFANSRIGQTLCGKYVLERVLGVGGMAAVYAATHRNRKQFAIKILHPALSASDGIRQRFLREGYVANSVRHPGAVAVLDDDVAQDGSAFLVMELLDGKSLEEIWSSHGGSLPVQTALCLVAQVLDVLDAAHRHGILHRDLKPPNLFLTREGSIKVLDFGIARLHDDAGQKLTSTGMSLGTPAFMAPEQVLGKNHEIDARSDIWAVGASLFVLLSGQLVHDGENSQQLMINAATRPARSLGEVGPGFPRALIDLVDRALSFEQAARFQSAAAMRVEVDAVHRELFGVPVPAALAEASAAELCESCGPDVGSAQSVPEAGHGEKSGARRALPADVEPAPAVPLEGAAPNQLSSEVRPVVPAAAPIDAPDPTVRSSRAAAHVEVNIAQVQSARLPSAISAVLAAVVLGGLAGAVLLGQRYGSLAGARNEAEPPGARDLAGTDPAAAPSRGLESGSVRPHGAGEDAVRSRAPRPLIQKTESPKKDRAQSPPRGSTAPDPPLAARCVRLLERQSLGEPLSAEERTHLMQRCRR